MFSPFTLYPMCKNNLKRHVSSWKTILQPPPHHHHHLLGRSGRSVRSDRAVNRIFMKCICVSTILITVCSVKHFRVRSSLPRVVVDQLLSVTHHILRLFGIVSSYRTVLNSVHCKERCIFYLSTCAVCHGRATRGFPGEEEDTLSNQFFFTLSGYGSFVFYRRN